MSADPRELEYYREFANQLGKMVFRLQRQEGLMQKESKRAYMLAEIVRRVHQEALLTESLEEAGRLFLRILLESLHCDRAAVYRYSPEQGRLTPLYSLGFAGGGPSGFFLPGAEDMSLALNSMAPNDDLALILRREAGARHLLWALKRGDGYGLLAARECEDQLLNPPFGAREQDIIETVLGVFVDVSRGKATRQALRRSDNIVRSIPTAILTFELADYGGLVLLNSNPAADAMLGRAFSEHHNQLLKKAWPVAEGTWLSRALFEVAEKGGAWEDEVFNIPEGASKGYYRARVFSPAPGLASVSLEDVTARKKAEEALSLSERRYRELFNSISDLIYTHDLDGRIISVNPAMAAILGFDDPAELAGRRIEEFAGVQGQDKLADYIARLKESGSAKGLELILSRNGEKRYWEFGSTMVNPPDGDPYVSGSGRDVTERLRSRQEVRHLEQQLLMAQKMEAVGTLAGGVAHDFNNMLQAIGGQVELLRKHLPKGAGDSSERLNQIETAVSRASAVVTRLLAHSREMKTEIIRVDMKRVLLRVMAALTPRLGPETKVTLDEADGDLTVAGDPLHIEQVAANLAANAVDAMPEGGELTFSLSLVALDQDYCRSRLGLEPGRYVRLVVGDSGVGMDEETLDHIFEPFFTTKPEGLGIGLGLSTVYGLVRSHGGHIEYTSRPGQGTMASVLLPALKTGEPPTDFAGQMMDIPEGGDETLLLVDDELSILEVNREVLASRGYKVIIAVSGEDALETFRDRQDEIDLVLMDLSMPGSGGEWCIKEILAIRPEAEILVISGKRKEDMDSFTINHAGGFLAKPFRMERLLALVREILDK